MGRIYHGSGNFYVVRSHTHGEVLPLQRIRPGIVYEVELSASLGLGAMPKYYRGSIEVIIPNIDGRNQNMIFSTFRKEVEKPAF